jgi:uncharacterized protein (DUF2141 family)
MFTVVSIAVVLMGTVPLSGASTIGGAPSFAGPTLERRHLGARAGAVIRDRAISTVVQAAPMTTSTGVAVAITSPTDGATFGTSATINIAAAVSDPNGLISKVVFYVGSTVVGSAYASPYTVAWANVPSGTFSLTAVAMGKRKHLTVKSASISITVTGAPPSGNPSPSISLTSPANGASYLAPATMTVAASAASTASSIASVTFMAGSQIIGSVNAKPYSITWNNVPPGKYNLKAVAFDNNGGSSTSNPLSVTVTASNQPPIVSLTSPVNGASFVAPATLTLSAAASDPDGSIAKVSFYAGTQLLGSVASSPYQLTWSTVPSGSYALTAVAYDNSGASTTSNAASVSVTPSTAPAQLTFTPSSDNATAVTYYELDLFPAGTNVSIASQNLGMPPIVNNVMTVDISALVQALSSGNYFSTVTAVGPGGSATSQPSNTFTR